MILAAARMGAGPMNRQDVSAKNIVSAKKMSRSVTELLGKDSLVEAVVGIEQHVHVDANDPC